MNFKKMDTQIANSMLSDVISDVDNGNYKHALININTILGLKYVDSALCKQLETTKQDILCGDVHDVRVDVYNIATYNFHTTISNQN